MQKVSMSRFGHYRTALNILLIATTLYDQKKYLKRKLILFLKIFYKNDRYNHVIALISSSVTITNALYFLSVICTMKENVSIK